MKKILLLSALSFGFGIINADQTNEDEIREKLVKLDEEKKDLKYNRDRLLKEMEQHDQESEDRWRLRCECAIIRGIFSEPGVEDLIGCEKEETLMETVYRIDYETRLRSKIKEQTEKVDKLEKEHEKLVEELQEIEKNKQ